MKLLFLSLLLVSSSAFSAELGGKSAVCAETVETYMSEELGLENLTVIDPSSKNDKIYYAYEYERSRCIGSYEVQTARKKLSNGFSTCEVTKVRKIKIPACVEYK